jgi:hypothetical protein
MGFPLLVHTGCASFDLRLNRSDEISTSCQLGLTYPPSDNIFSTVVPELRRTFQAVGSGECSEYEKKGDSMITCSCYPCHCRG